MILARRDGQSRLSEFLAIPDAAALHLRALIRLEVIDKILNVSRKSVRCRTGHEV
jgi:hypothetical protein